jgi:formate dehydrogenase maturation protein FdhE
MSFLAAGGVNYPARIARAELLTSRYPFAKEILSFYLHIAKFQKELYEHLPKAWGKRPIAPANGSFRSELHTGILLEPFGRFLSLIDAHGPAPLAAQAQRLKAQGDAAWASTLEEFWKAGLQESINPDAPPGTPAADPLQEFLSRAFLQPYAEFIAGATLPPVSAMTVCRCPRCNSLPLLGVLRPEGDGGKKYLQCSLCAQEWSFLRILCAHCGEQREEKLSVHTAEQFPHIRMEICETCLHLLRTVDLTKDGNAIPIIDDLAAIPLGLWGEQHGYRRIQQNLLHT